ncbi:conserved hypothetical protein [Leishmania infantum JPCM5]|uniref:Uncharacterized protein n=2 Tax=Leishmania infantum TaxID=5671 RepID=A4HRK2_LEIIN|nr:conserved hypothetical protein [Leishmania infantum JPCM5]CAC9436916.1 hypothetical_protein_-_conserved [Leishmania infantum]CAM65232.1 conserved hypothetical protein [Leishmania infantum JPCM5]SUZ38619.1 hypothetical_protein_-_conserved [Leishmania infantum]|eukprot:XP_001462694.1 conserved hypothetical protein [Leishmania infantum JPCM5]
MFTHTVPSLHTAAAVAPSTGSTSSSSAHSVRMHRPPKARTRGASGVPAAPAAAATSSSSSSAGSVVDARRGGMKGTAVDRATAPASSHHRSERDSRVNTEGSDSAARHTTPAAAASSFSDQGLRQLPQQRRGITSSTATPPGSARASHHSDADVARVRAALAEAGYPNPSWYDIERVFAQLAANQDDDDGNAAARHRDTAPTPSATYPSRRVVQENTLEEGHGAVYYHNTHGAVMAPPPVSPPKQQQQQQEDYPTESSGLLQHLEPSLRLQRYIHLRERELEKLCLRPSSSAPQAQQQRQPPVSPAVHGSGTLRSHSRDAPHASQMKAASLRGAAGERAGKQPQRRRSSAAAVPHAQRIRGGGDAVGTGAAASGDAQVTVMAAHHRRAANIVFDATGDQRFRFFPTTRTPPGTGTLVAMAPVARTSSSSTSTTVLTGAAPATSLGSYHNYYQCPRPSSCNTVGGQVSYLDPEGRTLRRKADPVKRGEQMRLLWAKDSFLSQRDRPREAWRTRQITMAYGQGSDGGEIHHG